VSLRLADNGVPVTKFDGGAGTTEKSRDGTLIFANKRAWAWWRLREELDPHQEGGATLALPPDAELRADLAAPTFKTTLRGIVIESKDDLRKRLGRSTGKGDAVAMCVGPGVLAEQIYLHSHQAPRVLRTRQAARRHLR
jgi:hypothetical protein